MRLSMRMRMKVKIVEINEKSRQDCLRTVNKNDKIV